MDFNSPNRMITDNEPVVISTVSFHKNNLGSSDDSFKNIFVRWTAVRGKLHHLLRFQSLARYVYEFLGGATRDTCSWKGQTRSWKVRHEIGKNEVEKFGLKLESPKNNWSSHFQFSWQLSKLIETFQLQPGFYNCSETFQLQKKRSNFTRLFLTSLGFPTLLRLFQLR